MIDDPDSCHFIGPLPAPPRGRKSARAVVSFRTLWGADQCLSRFAHRQNDLPCMAPDKGKSQDQRIHELKCRQNRTEKPCVAERNSCDRKHVKVARMHSAEILLDPLQVARPQDMIRFPGGAQVWSHSSVKPN